MDEYEDEEDADLEESQHSVDGEIKIPQQSQMPYQVIQPPMIDDSEDITYRSNDELPDEFDGW